MKGPALVDLTAEVFGLDAKTVFNIARALREAGYLTQGGRGRNAAHMTARDAARLSIGLLTGEPMSRVVERFEHYSKLQLREEDGGSKLQELLSLPDDHTLEDAVTGMFSLWDDEETLEPFRFEMEPLGSMEPTMFVRLNEAAQNCTVHFAGEEVVYCDVPHWARLRELNHEQRRLMDTGDFAEAAKVGAEFAALDEGRRSEFRGMRVTREISVVEIQKIALELAGGSDG